MLVWAIGIAVLVTAWATQVRQSLVDLGTGKQKTRLLMLGLCLREHVQETPCSALLQSGKDAVPDWRVFSETRPLQRISPHFVHHSTPTILQEIKVVGDLLKTPMDVRRTICVNVLERLRKDDTKGAQRLIDEWWCEARESYHRSNPDA
jgi:hypothetical protein